MTRVDNGVTATPGLGRGRKLVTATVEVDETEIRGVYPVLGIREEYVERKLTHS